MTPPLSPRILEERQMWQRKPVLRAIYHDLFRRMAAQCRPGPTLEVGAGGGNLKAFLPHLLSSDLQPAPWLDLVADGERLPFGPGRFTNLVGFDILHHLPHPLGFLREAARVLQPGGRVVLVEPHITPVSGAFYRLFHHEPVVMGVDPFAPEGVTGADPYDANQAIPTLLFRTHAPRLARELPELELTALRPLSLFTYPLSGGFRPWSLIPLPLVEPLLALEERLLPLLGGLASFRLLAVLQRR